MIKAKAGRQTFACGLGVVEQMGWGDLDPAIFWPQLHSEIRILDLVASFDLVTW